MPLDVEARVIRNTRLSSDYNVIALAAPEIAAAVAPGQFVMVKPGRGNDPLLRRPFSVFEILRPTTARIEGLTLLSKRIGVTTRMLLEAVEGDVVSCLGPLGKPFEPVDPPAEAWMVAGGVGLAPFATLTEALRERGTQTTLFYGARSDASCSTWIGSPRAACAGAQHRRRQQRRARSRDRVRSSASCSAPRADVTVYACGPEPMLEAVSRISGTVTADGRRCRWSESWGAGWVGATAA